jgi:DNA adenine methylase
MIYVGGKTKLRYHVTLALLKQANLYKVPYREPFVGGGGIFKFLTSRNITMQAWINDRDISVVCWWYAVKHFPNALTAGILKTPNTVDSFNKARNEILALKIMPTAPKDIVHVAVLKHILQYLSFSALGVRSGGAKGAKYITQRPLHKHGPRIRKWHEQIKTVDVRCTNADFTSLIEDKRPCVLYLDPPYTEQTHGKKVYQHEFTVEDHKRLAIALQKTSHPWVLSYDDAPLIRNLYSWATIAETGKQWYSTSGPRRVKSMKSELLITP